MALLRTRPPRTKDPSLYSAASRALSRRDPVLRDLIARIGPCQLRPRRQHFSTLCDSIISQQLSAKAAETICDRFASLYSGRTATPSRVMATRLPVFRRAGLSQQKAQYIKELAAGFSDGRLRATRFGHQSNEELIAALSSIRGIGRWTAEMFLIFSLNRLDVLPVDDLGIQKAVARWYGLPGPPKPAKLRALASPWHPYESVACWYLWQSLRL